MAYRPRFRGAKNIRADLKIDTSSLEALNRKLRRLEDAVREEVVRRALLQGGSLIQRAAKSRAPGPYIGIKVLKGHELMRGWRSAAAQGVKPDALYVAVGPDRKHWYYRFLEYGVKAHEVVRRKRTRYQQHLRKRYGMGIRKARQQRTGAKMGRTTGATRPAMVFTIDGKLVFARKVRGFPAKPFLRPAVSSQGNNAIQALGVVLGREIERVARS